MTELQQAIRELVERHGSYAVVMAALDEHIVAKAATQEIANKVRATLGLGPLEPPNPITGYQRRPPTPFQRGPGPVA